MPLWLSCWQRTSEVTSSHICTTGLLILNGRRQFQENLPEDEADSEWIQYKEKISHSTDSEDSIRWRMDFMLKDLFLMHPEIRLTDPKREFTPAQRLAVSGATGVCANFDFAAMGRSFGGTTGTVTISPRGVRAARQVSTTGVRLPHVQPCEGRSDREVTTGCR